MKFCWYLQFMYELAAEVTWHWSFSSGKVQLLNGMLIASINVSPEGVHRAVVVLVNVGIQRRVIKQAFSVNLSFWIHVNPRTLLTFLMTNILHRLHSNNGILGNLSIWHAKRSKVQVSVCLCSYSDIPFFCWCINFAKIRCAGAYSMSLNKIKSLGAKGSLLRQQ